ncbi:MAG: hypothetical protein H6541_06490 [Lentimicrobiaceae bacterium]|nr:hypothetical protein [Lentimicrobiaceae bacterium]MCB9023250.1 hypothetical protein [Lentimicrobiaceae bacterium]HPG32910.1 hypothetical protein [Lentimicrobium sp.]
MKKITLPLLAALFPALLFAQEAKDYSVTLGGFVSSESIFDSRQAVTAREGDVFLFPAPVSNDANGDDLNAIANFNMFSIHSRLQAKVSGPEMLGARSSALLEMDFVGNANPVISMMRLRHAIIKLEWAKTSLLVGQFWHPFFVLNSYPEVSGWGGGAPFAVLSRNPQIRFGFKLSNKLSGHISALTQRDFSSTGPGGASPDYMRNAVVPEVNLNLEYQNDGWKAGFVIGQKTLKPRLKDTEGLKFTKTLSSFQGNVYLRKDAGNFTAKIQGLYGENMYNFLMMGGYVESIDPLTGSIEYFNMKTASVWTELLLKKGKLTYSVFGGYSKNLGLSSSPDELAEINRYGRGSDINDTYRIAPRVTLTIHKFALMTEWSYNMAAYGSVQANGTVSNTTQADGFRLQTHLKYSF